MCKFPLTHVKIFNLRVKFCFSTLNSMSNYSTRKLVFRSGFVTFVLTSVTIFIFVFSICFLLDLTRYLYKSFWFSTKTFNIVVLTFAYRFVVLFFSSLPLCSCHQG